MKEIKKGVEILDNIVKHIDKRFLSSIDLIGQDDVTLTIDRIEKLDIITYENGNTEKNVILLYFKETQKPLKLNKANITLIAYSLNTNKCQEWIGKKIILHVLEVKAFGELKPAIRIKHEFKKIKK